MSYTPKYYASVMNIREFLADNLGNEFVGIIASHSMTTTEDTTTKEVKP